MKENEKKDIKYVVDDNETEKDLLLDLTKEELEQEYNRIKNKKN